MKNEIINTKFIAKGTAYYCKLDNPNTKGKFPSNCYEVGIANPTFSFAKNCTDEMVGEIFDNVINDLMKDSEDTKFIKIANSKYPIKVYDMNNNIIDNPRISNGINLIAKFTIKYNTNFDKLFIVVNGVKLLDEYKVSTPFDDINDFDIDF